MTPSGRKPGANTTLSIDDPDGVIDDHRCGPRADDVKFTTKTTHVALDPAKPGAKRGFDLPINTRVEVTETKDPTNKGWQRVIVISGTQRGKIGWISDPLSDTESFIPKSNRKP